MLLQPLQFIYIAYIARRGLADLPFIGHFKFDGPQTSIRVAQSHSEIVYYVRTCAISAV